MRLARVSRSPPARAIARRHRRSIVTASARATVDARTRLAGAALAVALTLASDARAVDAAPVVDRARTSAFAGRYADKKHPGCYREIFADGVVAGEDGDPGCAGTASRALARAWRLGGTIGVDDRSIFIDFSPKGGPANLLGSLVEPTRELPLGGVAFPDGNVWEKIP